MLHQEVSVGLARGLEAQPPVERHGAGVYIQHPESYRQAKTLPSSHDI